MAPGRRVTVDLPGPGSVLRLPAVVRSVSPAADRRPPADLPGTPAVDSAWVQVGVEFRDLPEPTAARLALALFGTGITPRRVYPDQPPARTPAVRTAA